MEPVYHISESDPCTQRMSGSEQIMISTIFKPTASYPTQSLWGSPIPNLSSLGKVTCTQSSGRGMIARVLADEGQEVSLQNHYTSCTAVQGEARVG